MGFRLIDPVKMHETVGIPILIKSVLLQSVNVRKDSSKYFSYLDVV